MGADIHAYPEYTEATRTGWSGFGRMSLPRDYDMFAKLAGVRGDNQMIPLRGVPVDACMTTRWDNQLYVSEDYPDSDGNCSPASAERWVNDGSSQWVDDRKRQVTNPDWHSHSYCSPAELRAVIEAEREINWGVDVRYWAVLAMLEEIERRGGSARLVYWFDN